MLGPKILNHVFIEKHILKSVESKNYIIQSFLPTWIIKYIGTIYCKRSNFKLWKGMSREVLVSLVTEIVRLKILFYTRGLPNGISSVLIRVSVV